MKYLQVTRVGLLFVVVTVALGVVALISGNNILYLLEAILLTSFAITGFMSERLLRSLNVDIFRSQACANELSPDLVRVRNLSKRPVHFIQIYEFFGKERRLLASIEELPGKREITLRSSARFDQRGRFHWGGFAYGSFYPFGFAFKCFSRKEPGSRIVWPSKNHSRRPDRETPTAQSHHRVGTQQTEAEVRRMQEGDTLRSVVWTLSDRIEDEWVVRPTRASIESRHIRLDCRELSDAELESQIDAAAAQFYEALADSSDASLTIIDSHGERKYLGAKASLDALALVGAKERCSA